jgi:two-component system, cell cycle response regulator
MATVLVIEDNEVNLELMQYLLTTCGHQVLVARDGIEGLRLLAQSRPDVVLCDIEMPRMDGVAFAQAAHADAATAGVPLLAVTSNAMVGDRARFLAAGFDDYISKPIDPPAFLQWMEGHVRGAAVPAPLAHGRSAALPQAVPTGPLVLVVDDLPENLALKRSCLEPMGYRVRTAGRADEALRMALEEPPALIISDVGMPEGDGFEFIARVRQQPALSRIPFIFISSTHRDAAAHDKALALGARRYLNRPLPIEQLLAEVKRALA